MNRKEVASRLRGLYGIADAGYRPDLPFAAKLAAFVEGGACAVQVRAKGASRALLDLARAGAAACRGRCLCIVNDRPDVALLAGADGVHVGDEDLSVAEVRRIVGDRLLVGATVREVDAAVAAVAAGADYLGFGPMAATKTKDVGVRPRTLDELSAVARAAGVPVVAIGGITLETSRPILAAGAACVAIISDVLGAPDLAARARAYARL